jgi:hypothetical protein
MRLLTSCGIDAGRGFHDSLFSDRIMPVFQNVLKWGGNSLLYGRKDKRFSLVGER